MDYGASSDEISHGRQCMAHCPRDSSIRLHRGRHTVHLVPLNVPWENHDTILGILSDIGPEIVVLAGLPP
jgi:hypothetical protein